MQIEKLLYEEESTSLDFKKEQYKFIGAEDYEKVELLKDILAFANAWRRTDAYILIGVEEVKGGRSIPLGIDDRLEGAQIQQFINSKTQRPLEFEYKVTLIDELRIGVIKIPVQKRPFYLKSDYNRLKKSIVYIRRGDSTSEADPDEVHKMGLAESNESQEIPNITFEFANIDERISLGKKLDITAILLDIPSHIPDYVEDEEYYEFGGVKIAQPNLGISINRDYYRELVAYYFVQKKSNKLSFYLCNDSSTIITDIRVEIIIDKSLEKFIFIGSDDLPKFPESSHNNLFHHQPIMPQC